MKPVDQPRGCAGWPGRAAPQPGQDAGERGDLGRLFRASQYGRCGYLGDGWMKAVTTAWLSRHTFFGRLPGAVLLLELHPR
jgi:hypothetical protein